MDTGCLFVRFVVDDGTILYAVKMINEEYIDHRDKFVRDANRYDAIYQKFGHHVNTDDLSRSPIICLCYDDTRELCLPVAFYPQLS